MGLPLLESLEVSFFLLFCFGLCSAMSNPFSGAVISACFGPIVSSFPPDQAAFATRFCLVLPGSFCIVTSVAYLLLLIPRREDGLKIVAREQTFVNFKK